MSNTCTVANERATYAAAIVDVDVWKMVIKIDLSGGGKWHTRFV